MYKSNSSSSKTRKGSVFSLFVYGFLYFCSYMFRNGAVSQRNDELSHCPSYYCQLLLFLANFTLRYFYYSASFDMISYDIIFMAKRFLMTAHCQFKKKSSPIFSKFVYNVFNCYLAQGLAVNLA